MIDVAEAIEMVKAQLSWAMFSKDVSTVGLLATMFRTIEKAAPLNDDLAKAGADLAVRLTSIPLVHHDNNETDDPELIENAELFKNTLQEFEFKVTYEEDK